MKITKTQLKQIIKEELEEMQRYDPSQELSAQGLSRDETLYYEPDDEDSTPPPTPPAETVAEKVLTLPAEALSLIWDFITGGGRSDASESGYEGHPDPGGTYRGTDDPSMGTRYGESINRDKLATLVAEEVRKILKNK